MHAAGGPLGASDPPANASAYRYRCLPVCAGSTFQILLEKNMGACDEAALPVTFRKVFVTFSDVFVTYKTPCKAFYIAQKSH